MKLNIEKHIKTNAKQNSINDELIEPFIKTKVKTGPKTKNFENPSKRKVIIELKTIKLEHMLCFLCFFYDTTLG